MMILTKKKMQQKIESDVINILMPRVKNNLQKNNVLFGNEKYHVNPTGKFVIGGPHGDTGLTGRKLLLILMEAKELMEEVLFQVKILQKLIVLAYATRYIAKNLVGAGVADRILVQVSYAIGVAEPMEFL